MRTADAGERYEPNEPARSTCCTSDASSPSSCRSSDHPVEIAASALLKVGVVYLIGPAALAVLVFEILLNATAMFNHANLRLPGWLDRLVRLVLVTPDMHRVHHSVHREEHDSNYGFALSVWDRIFGTYVPEPKAGQTEMTVGLEWQDDRTMRLGWVLGLPFFRR